MASVRAIIPYCQAESDLIKKLWSEGKSSREIAALANARFRRGRTRNAIIGVVNRSGLQQRGKPVARVAPVPRSPAPAGRSVPQGKKLTRGATTNSLVKAREARAKALVGQKRAPLRARGVDAAPVAPLRLTILEVGDHTCRFPVTHDLPHRFCGHAPVPGKSYCGPHLTMVLAAPAPDAE